MSVLDKALQYATQAITEDGAQNYESAYRLYASAVQEMELAYHSLFDTPQLHHPITHIHQPSRKCGMYCS